MSQQLIQQLSEHFTQKPNVSLRVELDEKSGNHQSVGNNPLNSMDVCVKYRGNQSNKIYL